MFRGVGVRVTIIIYFSFILKYMKLNFQSESELVRYCEEYRAKKEECNGWTNYNTWRVNLELVDPVYYEKSECGRDFESVYELSEAIRQDVEAYLGDEVGGGAKGGTCYDYALAFVSCVNWYEIAENMASDNEKIIIKLDK